MALFKRCSQRRKTVNYRGKQAKTEYIDEPVAQSVISKADADKGNGLPRLERQWDGEKWEIYSLSHLQGVSDSRSEKPHSYFPPVPAAPDVSART